MKCLEFHVRLDAGDLATLDAEARAHAAACADCARALAHAEQLEALLAAEFASAPLAAVPHEFTDRLMARVEATPQLRWDPAALARSAGSALAAPAIAVPALAGVALLAFAATQGFDAARISRAVTSASEPLARVAAELVRPLPTSGAAHEVAVAGLALAGLPLLAVAIAAAWQLGNAIADRTPRAL